jgi:hypothetical protein
MDGLPRRTGEIVVYSRRLRFAATLASRAGRDPRETGEDAVRHIVMMIGLATAAAIAAVALIAWTKSNPAPELETLVHINANKSNCASLINDAQRQEVIRGVVRVGKEEVVVQVEDWMWLRLSTEERVKLSLTAYCAFASANGYLAVMVRKPDGEAVFRIVNGHVRPWW